MHTPSGEEYYYRRSGEIQNGHPEWTTDQITNKMSEEIWNNNYNALMDDIAHSKTPEERDQKIKDYQAELDNYKASGINVDNDVEYLRDVQGMPKETISSKIVSLMSKYSFNGVEYQYSVPPGSFAFVEIPKDGISIEKYTDYQIQKNDDENTLHNSFQQQVEELLAKVKKLENVHKLLDVAGFVPAAGAVPDLGNSALYLFEGNYEEARNSGLAAVPFAGDYFALAVKGSKIIKGVDETRNAVVQVERIVSQDVGKAPNANNYRKLFLKENPEMPKTYQVHHTLPQKYEEILNATEKNIHETQYLEGVDQKIHSKITSEWVRWDKSLEGTPSAEEVIDFAKQIDSKYGSYWYNK